MFYFILYFLLLFNIFFVSGGKKLSQARLHGEQAEKKRESEKESEEGESWKGSEKESVYMLFW